jgi:AbrB family looped-hinge helix DNA binding protein
MNIHDGKFAWMVKIGEKGQFVIPKEARDVFGFQPGEEILVLGDVNRGIAILPREMQREYIARLFEQTEE